MVKSIIDGNTGIDADSVCYLCKTNRNLERHHIFGGANREKSEEYGLTVILCHNCHNEPPNGVHHNKQMDLWLKMYTQQTYERHHTRDEFIRLIGKNYL